MLFVHKTSNKYHTRIKFESISSYGDSGMFSLRCQLAEWKRFKLFDRQYWAACSESAEEVSKTSQYRLTFLLRDRVRLELSIDMYTFR